MSLAQSLCYRIFAYHNLHVCINLQCWTARHSAKSSQNYIYFNSTDVNVPRTSKPLLASARICVTEHNIINHSPNPRYNIKKLDKVKQILVEQKATVALAIW